MNNKWWVRLAWCGGASSCLGHTWPQKLLTSRAEILLSLTKTVCSQELVLPKEGFNSLWGLIFHAWITTQVEQHFWFWSFKVTNLNCSQGVKLLWPKASLLWFSAQWHLRPSELSGLSPAPPSDGASLSHTTPRLDGPGAAQLSDSDRSWAEILEAQPVERDMSTWLWKFPNSAMHLVHAPLVCESVNVQMHYQCCSLVES